MVQGPGQVRGSKEATKPKATPEKVTTPQVTLADELQCTRPGKSEAKSKEVCFPIDGGATTDTLRKSGQASNKIL